MEKVENVPKLMCANISLQKQRGAWLHQAVRAECPPCSGSSCLSRNASRRLNRDLPSEHGQTGQEHGTSDGNVQENPPPSFLPRRCWHRGEESP